MKIKLLLFTLLLTFQTSFAQEMSKIKRTGTEHFFKGEYELALKYFLKENKKNPTSNTSFWIGHTYAEMGNISEAKPIFYKIVQNKPQSPDYAMSILNLGNCYRNNLPDSAFFYYDKAIKEFPLMADTYYNKGTLLKKQAKFEKAIINLTKAIEVDSTIWIYHQKRLEACFAYEDYKCALMGLIKVRELNPKAQNEMNLAFCYSMLERYNEADSIFQMIYDAKSAFFLNNYGMNKHNMGQTAEGKNLIEKSISINPNNSYAYRNLAIIAISKNDEEMTCKYLIKAESLGFLEQYGEEVEKLKQKYCN